MSAANFSDIMKVNKALLNHYDLEDYYKIQVLSYKDHCMCQVEDTLGSSVVD